MDFKRMETASRAIQLIRELLSLSVILIQQCLQFAVFKLFRWFFMFFVSHVKIATFEFFKPLKALIYQEHAHRKLRQAFDAILQQFSSNDNRKSMLSANRSLCVVGTKFDIFNAITNYTVV